MAAQAFAVEQWLHLGAEIHSRLGDKKGISQDGRHD